MGKIRKFASGVKRVAQGWTRPTKKQAIAFMGKRAEIAMQEFWRELERQTEQHEREHPYPNIIEPVERTKPTFFSLVQEVNDQRISRQASSALDAAGIFDKKLRGDVEATTFRLLEEEQALLGKKEEAREILAWLANGGWKLPSTDPKQLTEKQALQIMDRYAVDQISSALLRVPRTRTFQELEEFAGVARANRRKLELQSKVRKAKAWLYWKRFKMLDEKFLKTMKSHKKPRGG